MLMSRGMHKQAVLLVFVSAVAIYAAYRLPYAYLLPLAFAACVSTLFSLLIWRWASRRKSRQRWLSGNVLLSYALLALFFLILSALAAFRVAWSALALGWAIPSAFLIAGLIAAKAPSPASWVRVSAVALAALCLFRFYLIGSIDLFLLAGIAPMMAAWLGFKVYASCRPALQPADADGVSDRQV